MHVLISQSEVLHSSCIDASITEPCNEDLMDEQLDGSHVDGEEHCSPVTVSSRRKQIHLRKRGK